MQEIQAFDAIIESLSALSEYQLTEHNLYKLIAHYTYEHYNEHAADIRKRFKSPVKR